MRAFIDLVEAAFPGGMTFWFNPATKELIRCSDHGTAVENEPEKFGIDYRVQGQIRDAYPEEPYDDDPDDDDQDEPDYGRPIPSGMVDGLWGDASGWDRNDVWEQLAMNNGWVRVGVGRNGEYATYLSSSTGLAVWHAARYLAAQDSLTDRMEIEVSREQNALFITLGAESIEQFLRTRSPDAFLAQMEKRQQLRLPK